MAHSVLDRAWAQASEPYLLACQIFLLAIPPDSQVVPAEAASQDEEGEEEPRGSRGDRRRCPQGCWAKISAS